MIRRPFNIVLFIVIFLTSSGVHVSQQGTVLKTDLFVVNFPNVIKPLQLKSQNNGKNDFTFAYIESNKEQNKSILIVISVKRNEDIKKHDLNSVLYTATGALRESTLKSNCKGVPTALAETSIGNSRALFFEKTNHDCMVSIEKYWSVIKGDHFITFYIAKPIDGNVDLFNQVQKAIEQVSFK